MGKILSGILGPVTGKVGPVVGGTWKDQAYVRSYVIPANPNTVAQQAQRTKFGECVDFAKLLVGQVFNVYTDPFLKSMSGYNFFIKRNIDVFDGSTDYSALKLTEGKLAVPAIISVVPDESDARAVVTFDTTNGSNGAATDKVFACVYNVDTGAMGFAAAEVNRSTGTIDVPMQVSAGDNCWAWVWAAKYDGTTLLSISNSNAIDGVAVA